MVNSFTGMDLASHWAGDGFPVVCLPSFSTDRQITEAAFDEAMAAAGGLRRCYVDLPGHGESPPGPPTSDGVVDAVSGFIDRQLPGQRFLLAGWSYGAYISAALARRRPADVAGMLLVCPGVTINMADRDLPAGAAADGEPGWLDDVPPHLREHLWQALGNRTREVARRVAELLAGSARGDEEYRRRLRSGGYPVRDEQSAFPFGGPTSVITGRQDRIVGYADQFRRMRSYPFGSYAMLDQAGHYLPFEQPEAFAGLVAEWHRRCEQAGALRVWSPSGAGGATELRSTGNWSPGGPSGASETNSPAAWSRGDAGGTAQTGSSAAWSPGSASGTAAPGPSEAWSPDSTSGATETESPPAWSPGDTSSATEPGS